MIFRNSYLDGMTIFHKILNAFYKSIITDHSKIIKISVLSRNPSSSFPSLLLNSILQLFLVFDKKNSPGETPRLLQR